MSTSDSSPAGGVAVVPAAVPSRSGPFHARIARRYLVAAIGCAGFALVYAQFSHGVYSPFMTFMFAIPLFGGAVPAFALHLVRVRPLPRAARQAWALALASLAVGSCLRGVFDIAGTASPYVVAYVVFAGAFALGAAGLVLRARLSGQAPA